MDADEAQLGMPVPGRDGLVAVAKAGGHEILYPDRGEETGNAAFPFLCRRRRIAGVFVNVLELAGSDFFDYVAHFNGREARELLTCIGDLARNVNADCVAVEQVLSPVLTDATLAERHFQTGVISGKDGRPLSETVLRHTSVKRHIRTAERKIGLMAETIDDPVRIAAILPEMIALHKERWNFDGMESAFDAPTRIGQYEAASGRALVTRVMSGSEVLAVHYGLWFGKTLVWHTPVINVAFLEYSPLEILLGKVAETCTEKEIEHLDLGLGDESYKARFSTGSRDVYGYILPITARGRAAAFLYDGRRSERVRDRLLRAVASVRAVRSVLRQRFTSVRHFRSPPGMPAESGECWEIENWRDFVALLRQSGEEIRRFQYDRIRGGSRFVCLTENGSIRCSGWLSKAETPFPVGETGEQMPGGPPVLYDFVTPVEYRKQGYYTRLLSAIRSAHAGKALRIFASSDNAASIAAIRKAGFEEYRS